MKSVGLLIVIFCTSMFASAEYRIWTNNKGYSIEAEYTGMENGLVILKKHDGKVFKLNPASLSETDQDYLSNIAGVDTSTAVANDSESTVLDVEKPPRLDIKVSANTDSTAVDYDEVRRDVTMGITIKKESMQPYSKKLKGKLFAVGLAKPDNNYVLLAKQEFEFDFVNVREFKLDADMFSSRYYRSDKWGLEYQDYVLVIYDDQGKELTLKSSNNEFRDARNKLDKLNRNDVFNKTYKKVGVRSGMGYYYQ